jgi:hypothetical protein
MNPLLFGLIGKVIDGVSGFLDPTKKAEAQLAVLKLQQDGEFREIEAQLKLVEMGRDTIVAEASSGDKWTSRARPSFMYVIYILILSSIPMGVLYAFNPATALGITSGFKAWLEAIPSEMLALFGVGYVGYVGARSLEKRNKNA